MAVALDSIAVELGLGGRIRDILINESFTQGCWPLAELFSTTFRDVSGNNRHAALNGSGFTRGIATGLPEQHMGLTFNGGYLSVTDDGNGAMSLHGGSMDIAFLIKTSTNDATQRTIIVKRNAGDTDGWYVGLVSAGIRFRLRAASATIFDFTRGSIADGNWHLIHCYYDPPTQEARIFIDGVQSGATVGTTNTDPPNVLVNLYIGGNDPAGASTLSSTSLAFMHIGREGNLTLAASLHAARSFTTLSSRDVFLNEGVSVRYGNSGNKVTDWVASSGSMQFTLNNTVSNSAGLVGYYSPGHASCRTGFTVGIPVRLTLTAAGTTRYKFQGRIVSIAPQAGQVGFSRGGTIVTCTDWLDVAARSRFVSAEAQVSQRSTDVLQYLIDFADQAPGNVSIGTGTQILGYALDAGQSEREPMLSEINRVASSEMMYVYMRGNDTDGMTLVAETRFARHADTTLDATYTDTMAGLELADDVGLIINEARATCYPPTIDAAATTVLYTLLANSTVSHPISAGSTLVLDAPYTDPNDRPSRVGGTALVTPASTTDYTGNTAADGSGTDKTSSLTVTAILGASAMRVSITNGDTDTVFLTKLQLRGKGIYRYQQSPALAQDTQSIRQHGTADTDLEMPYQQSVTMAQSLASAVVDLYSQPTTRPTRMTIRANHDSTLMNEALVREIGDHVGIVETVSGLVAGDGYFIHEVDLTCHGLHDLQVTYGLIPAWPSRLLLSYIGPTGSFIHDFSGSATLSLIDPGDYTFMFNRTGDNIAVRGVAGGGGGGAGTADSTNQAGGAGGGGGTCQTSGITVAIATTGYTGKVGAGGTGAQSAGATGSTGGTTEFRVPSGTVHMQLPGGVGGGGASGATPGTGGAGGGAGTGSGNVTGTSGAIGGAGAGGGNASNNASGAAGGGGGGDTGAGGGNGGNGKDQTGGAGGGVGATGTTASGLGGAPGSSSPGGGGGGGGGVSMGGFFCGGGGGGGAGTQGSPGSGGDGGQGALTLTKV